MENNDIQKSKQKPHNLTLENRSKATMTGVESVLNSTDSVINLATSQGGLSLNGKELKIEKFNIEEQTLVISGQIDTFRYEQLKAPLLKRLFK